MTEPGSSQWVPMEGLEAMGTNEVQKIPYNPKEELYDCIFTG